MTALVLVLGALAVLGAVLVVRGERIQREMQDAAERDLDAAWVEAWAVIAESRPSWRSFSSHDQ